MIRTPAMQAGLAIQRYRYQGHLPLGRLPSEKARLGAEHDAAVSIVPGAANSCQPKLTDGSTQPRISRPTAARHSESVATRSQWNELHDY